MKNVLRVLGIIVVMAAIAVPCYAQPKPSDVKGNLRVWSFTDELTTMINKHAKATYKNLTFDYSQIATEQFPARLDAVLAGNGAPDVFALESAFVRKYVESGELLDLTDIYEANKDKLLAYPVEIGTHNGRVYALSWQACPGAMFYRRSLAKKYLGTDDPKVVQDYFANMDKFLETAKILSEKSDWVCRVISSPGDLFFPYLSLRTNPWVVNGQLHIDPAVEEYMDMVKILNDNGYLVGGGQWDAVWFAGMRDNEVKEWDGSSYFGSGRPLEVFAYFLPTWGLHYVLKTNTPNTSGDWAMIPGPVQWRWGGTWLAASKHTSNPTAAKELIRYLTTDNRFLEKWAKDTGDFVSNTQVVNKIKSGYKERFLGNQNHYIVFEEAAKAVNGKLFQGTDDVIQALFNEQISPFLWEGKSKEQALADFRAAVNSNVRF